MERIKALTPAEQDEVLAFIRQLPASAAAAPAGSQSVPLASQAEAADAAPDAQRSGPSATVVAA